MAESLEHVAWKVRVRTELVALGWAGGVERDYGRGGSSSTGDCVLSKDGRMVAIEIQISGQTDMATILRTCRAYADWQSTEQGRYFADVCPFSPDEIDRFFPAGADGLKAAMAALGTDISTWKSSLSADVSLPFTGGRHLSDRRAEMLDMFRVVWIVPDRGRAEGEKAVAGRSLSADFRPRALMERPVMAAPVFALTDLDHTLPRWGDIAKLRENDPRRAEYRHQAGDTVGRLARAVADGAFSISVPSCLRSRFRVCPLLALSPGTEAVFPGRESAPEIGRHLAFGGVMLEPCDGVGEPVFVPPKALSPELAAATDAAIRKAWKIAADEFDGVGPCPRMVLCADGGFRAMIPVPQSDNPLRQTSLAGYASPTDPVMTSLVEACEKGRVRLPWFGLEAELADPRDATWVVDGQSLRPQSSPAASNDPEDLLTALHADLRRQERYAAIRGWNSAVGGIVAQRGRNAILDGFGRGSPIHLEALRESRSTGICWTAISAAAATSVRKSTAQGLMSRGCLQY